MTSALALALERPLPAVAWPQAIRSSLAGAPLAWDNCRGAPPVAGASTSYGGLGAVLESLAALETRHRDRSFDDFRWAILAGQPEAWKAFVEKYSRFVYAVALQLLAKTADREEAAASVYARVFERLAAGGFRLVREFQNRCLFTTYLYRIVQSERKEYFARQARRTQPVLDETAAAGRAASSPPGPVLRPDALRRAAREAVDHLDAEERLVLLLRFREGLKLREIASVLGHRDVGAAARALYRALGRLELLKELRERYRLGWADIALLGEALGRELGQAAEAAREGVGPP